MALIAICLIVPLYTLGSCRAVAEDEDLTAPTNELGENRKIVLAHYMPWYTMGPQWGLHWAGPQQQHDPEMLDENGLPDIWSHYHPLIGLYDSQDPDVIECQLLQMKLAGIDGVILDWYGISSAADYPSIHRAAEAAFRGAEKLGMQFAVCYEDRTVRLLLDQQVIDPEDIEQHLTETFLWLEKNWFGSPQYVRIDGRPLLLNFGPLSVEDPKVWNTALGSLSTRPQFFALHHLWRGVGADGGFAWVYAKAWEEAPTQEQIQEVLTREYNAISDDSNQIIASALPGFNDIYKNGHPSVAHRDGATMRESLAFAMQGKWPIVQLVTWNDYGEGTMIEPTHEFGYQFLEIIQDARRKEPGKAFTNRPNDLRLPGRLYQLRQAGTVETEVLDKISQALARGEASKAKSIIDQLSDSRFEDFVHKVSSITTP